MKMKMPSGKYKGKDIESIPSSYLKWVAENWQEKTAHDKAVCEAADKEWAYREKTGTHFETNTDDFSIMLKASATNSHSFCPTCGRPLP